MKKHIPNLFTSLNLFSGCIASIMAFEGNYLWVVIWVIVAAIFDFFDGFMARILNAPSAIGKELDSLADVVSFGVAPSLMAFHFLSANVQGLDFLPVLNPYIPYFSFLLVVFSALRLAKFNVDERQTTSFIGLPTPANALFWISYLFGISELPVSFSPAILVSLTLLLIILFSFLMVAEIPMFSLKIKNLAFKGNELRYSLGVFMIIALILAGILGIAFGMLFYVLLSVCSFWAGKKA